MALGFEAMERVRTIVCALVVALGVATPAGRASAQILTGVLLERGSERPVDLALLTLLTLEGDSVAAALSDAEGRFRLVAPEGGDYRLAATGLGYRSTVARSVFSLPEGSSMSVEFRIEPRPVEIGGITVETRSSLIDQPTLVRNGFVDRAERGFGRFITPVDIERSTARSTSELLSRTGRVTTQYAVGGDRIVMRGTSGYCTPTVWVDGARIDLRFEPIDAVAPASALYAAEVYRSGSEAPPQYGGTTSGGCGVIVLWTRGG